MGYLVMKMKHVVLAVLVAILVLWAFAYAQHTFVSPGQTIAPAPPVSNPISVYLSPMAVKLPAASAHATFTTPHVFWTGKTYDVFVLYAGITGSPSGCTLTPAVSADGVTFVAQSGLSLSPSTGTAIATSSQGTVIGYQAVFTYACSSTYPTAGTAQVFVVTHQ